MANEKTILITGATGKQGGATLRHLAKRGGFKLRAMTRKPDSDAAKAVAALGAEVVAGDLDDAASLERALAGAWGVFAVQNTWEAGRRAARKSRASASRRSRATRACSTSSTRRSARPTGARDPALREQGPRRGDGQALKFPSHVILRPVFFMENLPSPWFLNGDKLTTALKPETKLQMVAVDDIGKFGAAAFAEADKFKGAEIDYRGRRRHDARGGRGDQRADSARRSPTSRSRSRQCARTARTSR